MEDVIGKFAELFETDSVARDETGCLASVARLLPALDASLMLIADGEGKVVAADNLGSSVDFEFSLSLAHELHQRLAEAQTAVFQTFAEGEPSLAFGVRLGVGADRALLGGLVRPSEDAEQQFESVWPVLATCGALARRAIQTHLDGATLRTRIRHLLAEQETLRASHTEAIAAVIEEHEERLREQQNRMALEERYHATRAADKAKSAFLANMSHEIRTPLNAILGFTQLLLRGADEGDENERRNYLETIHTSGKHLLCLINDILDLSKIEAGQMEIERIRYSPHKLVSEVVSLLRVQAEEHGLTLESQWHPGVPETIQSDPARLRQLLMNLVGNAIKFTETGGVRIVGKLIHTQGNPQLAFEVIDTGIGIAEDKLESIFDPFVQADSSVTRRFGGTGLGLAISRRIVEALGGTLGVQSQLGKGSVFTATVDTGPLEGIMLVDSPSCDALAAAKPRQQQQQIMLSGARILLVEDGETNRKLISLILRRAQAEVATAENGQEGVELATQQQFDLIFMDMQMPVLDGYAATTRLRELGLTVPIIALTAHAMTGDAEKCKAAGCSGYLTKPVDADLLLRTAAEAMAAADAGCADAGPPPAKAPAEAPALVSSLPTDDPEFREIVEEFVHRLKEQLEVMQRVWAAKDLAELARLAHWLKGSGGTAGFAAFTAPAKRLEELTKQGQYDQAKAAIAALVDLAARIVVPPVPSNPTGTGSP